MPSMPAATDALDASATPAAPPPPAEDAPLPEGWEALADADGDVYFHHPSTGEVSWVRPC